MKDLITAIGLLLIIEGAAIAIFGPRPVVAFAGLVVLGGGVFLQLTGRLRLLDSD